MDWIIPVSKAEQERRTLSPQSTEAVFRALHISGVALLRGAITESVVEGLYKEYLDQFGGLDAEGMKALAASPPPHPFMKVGPKRYDVAPRMVGAFADEAVFANPLILPVLRQLLGADLRLGGFTAVASFPGAPAQVIHRDHPHLYPESDLGAVLPTHAINVSVPLTDVDIETGPTAIWLGSHRWPETRQPEPEAGTQVPFQRGDCVMLDYRMLHSGRPNYSQRMRPILYMTYTRTWFFDETNYRTRKPLNMSLDTLLGLSETARHLLLRAYAQAMRSGRTAEATEASLNMHRSAG